MVRFVTMYGFLVLISMRIDLTQLDYWWRSRYERMSLHERINWKARLFRQGYTSSALPWGRLLSELPY